MEYQVIANTLISILEKYGMIGIIAALAILIIYKVSDKYLLKITEIILDKSIDKNKSIKRRRRKDSIFKVNRLLKELMDKLEVDRISIFEYHNGGCNLANLPFLHFSIVTQLNRLGVDDLNKDFDKVHVSSIPDFIYELDKSEYYHIPVDKLQYTFPKMHKELKNDNMKEVIFANIEGSEDPIGFIMLAFKDTIKVSKKKLTKELSKKLQKIAIYLDGKI